MAEIDYIIPGEQAEHRRIKIDCVQLETPWTKQDREDFNSSPFCNRCLKWDVVDFSAKNREDYCNMVKISDDVYESQA